jgi:hypothetical protein
MTRTRAEGIRTFETVAQQWRHTVQPYRDSQLAEAFPRVGKV